MAFTAVRLNILKSCLSSNRLLSWAPGCVSRAVTQPSLRHFSVSSSFSEGPQPPSVRYQKALSRVELKEKRAESQRMGKEIVIVNLGRNGISHNFVVGLTGALKKNELVKVRLSGGCDIDKHEAKEQCEQLTDSVCVHSIGSTFTLYRSKTLPAVALGAAASEEPSHNLPVDDDLIEHEEGTVEVEDTEESELEQPAKGRKQRRPRKPQRPSTGQSALESLPEFTIL